MPNAQLNDANIYYEVMGEGKPLVLVMGLGGNLDWWGTGFRKYLARHRQVIALDNRGAGETTAPDAPFTIHHMAGDIAHLLDYLSLETADVMGLSMGGMIAQELALSFPDRVDKLILGCTSCGGLEQRPPSEFAWRLLTEERASAEAAKAHELQLLFPTSFVEDNPGLIDEVYKHLMRRPMSREDFHRQFGAIINWQGSYHRLPWLAHETLILHGTEDILLPVENSEILADRIVHAQLIQYPGCGHGFVVQVGSQVLHDVEAFLEN